jgi:phenylalanyl-tRNA synthetase alpha chain
MSESEATIEMERGIAQIEASYREALESARDENELRRRNAQYVGAEGELTKLMKWMPKVPGDRKKDLGRRVNQLKQTIEALFSARLEAIEAEAMRAELEGPFLDVSLAGRGVRPGRLHPITRVEAELLDIFGALGFDVADGPLVDYHENCFDRLGFPPDHPATDMQDTFFVTRRQTGASATTLLRTHTSTIQIREMMRRKPPLAVVAPGTVFRRDDDATHSPMFYQLEGFLVDRDVSFADLKGVLTLFAKRLFHEDILVRFRPSYFPFVEPGGEVDISCVFCEAWTHDHERTAGCKVCKGTGWLEVLGCGMIHPVVFENVGYDPEEVTGFAFGMGLDRIAMLKYGIPNIKLLYENDVRFLSGF